MEVHLEKTTDFGVMKSESIKIGDQSTYYLKFPKETSSSAVGDFVRNHLYDNVRAISLNDFSLIENNYDKSGNRTRKTVIIYNIYTKRNYRRFINNGNS